jgi:hypothetical protein
MATEKFHYKIGTTKITLPSLAKLPMGVARKTRKLSEENAAEALFIMFEELFDEGSPELDAFDTLNPEELAALMTAWTDYSGVSLGESRAS